MSYPSFRKMNFAAFALAALAATTARAEVLPGALEISCDDGVTRLAATVDPKDKSIRFEAGVGAEELFGDTHFATTRVPPIKEFEVTYSKNEGSTLVGPTLHVKSFNNVKVWVPTHVECRPTRSPDPCHFAVTVPGHYEDKRLQGIDLWLEDKGGANFSGFAFLLGFQPSLNLDWNKPACKVKGL